MSKGTHEDLPERRLAFWTTGARAATDRMLDALTRVSDHERQPPGGRSAKYARWMRPPTNCSGRRPRMTSSMQSPWPTAEPSSADVISTSSELSPPSQTTRAADRPALAHPAASAATRLNTKNPAANGVTVDSIAESTNGDSNAPPTRLMTPIVEAAVPAA